MRYSVQQQLHDDLSGIEAGGLRKFQVQFCERPHPLHGTHHSSRREGSECHLAPCINVQHIGDADMLSSSPQVLGFRVLPQAAMVLES